MLKNIIKSSFIFVVISILIIASLPSSVSAASDDDYNYIVYTTNLGNIFGDGDIGFYQNSSDTGSFYDLPIINGNSGFLQNPFFYCAQKDSSKIASRVICQPTWTLDTSIFNGSKQYIFDFYIGVTKNGSNAFINLKRFYFRFGNYNSKYYNPIEYIYGAGSSTLGYAHFRFTVDGQILANSLSYCTFDFEDFNANYTISFGLPKEEPYTTFTIREYTEADQIADIGSDISQPDFSGANGSLGSATDDLKSFDDEYKIDMEQTSSDLESGMTTLNGHDMQNASIQVKNWIERFANENTVYTGFIVGGLTLAVCFWVIGRKGWE